MKTDEYKAWACFPDGSVIGAEGSIQDVANWADNVIRASQQEITIKIVRKDGKQNA